MLRSTLYATTALLSVGLAFAGTTARAADGLTFQAIPAPTTDSDKRAVLATGEVTVDGASTPVGYHTLLRSGQKVGDGTFGQILDQNGKPILGKDGAPTISNATDFSSLLQVGDKLFIVSHFETRPAAVYVTEVKRDPATGELSAGSTAPVDFSKLGGLWVPCAGSVTPWGTHLGSEEYEPDARKIEAAASLKDIGDYNLPMALYFGYDPYAPDATADGFRKVFNPYNYGWATEITVEESGKAEAAKHYAMGRMAHELEYALPDQKTVYLTDDGTNTGLFMFVADQAGKLDAGTLYAMKWSQASAEDGGTADIGWVDLGHADSASVQALIQKGTTFSDIFEVAKMGDDGNCPEGFKGSNANGVSECLKIKPGMELAASRLETRRYASMLGATTELRKEEGITYDPDRGRLYVAMSEIANGMEDAQSKGKPSTKYEAGGENAIRVGYNPCGGIYALDLAKDETIGSDFVAKTMKGVVMGKPTTYAKDSPYAGNTCDMDGLANPDNISYIPGRSTLLIGEDTETGHQNDAVWSYNLDSDTLTRIQTTPYGSETTSVYAYPDIGGHAYIMSVIQHPYGESDEDKLQSPDQAQAYLGYIGPMPKLD